MFRLIRLRDAICFYFGLARPHSQPFLNAVQPALPHCRWSLIKTGTVCHWPTLRYGCGSESRVSSHTSSGVMSGGLPEVTGELSVWVKEAVSYLWPPCKWVPEARLAAVVPDSFRALLHSGCPRTARERRGPRLCISPSSSTASRPRQPRDCSWLSWMRLGRAALAPCHTSWF